VIGRSTSKTGLSPLGNCAEERNYINRVFPQVSPDDINFHMYVKPSYRAEQIGIAVCEHD